MAYRLEASGTRRVTPTSADDDGIQTAIIPSDSSVTFEAFIATGTIYLTSDAPVPIPLGPALVDEFNYLVVRVKGGRVNVTLASSLDATAIIPVEPRLELRTDNLGLTGLTLTRQTGVEVTVDVWLGKRS